MYRPVDCIKCNLKSACRFVEVRKRAGFEHLFPALFLHYLDISDSFNQMQCYEFSLWRDCVKVYSVTSYKPVLFHSLLSMCITCVQLGDWSHSVSIVTGENVKFFLSQRHKNVIVFNISVWLPELLMSSLQTTIKSQIVCLPLAVPIWKRYI